MTHMKPSPYGILNPSSICMENIRKFPKPFKAETKENLNGFPRYKRRTGTYMPKVARGNEILVDKSFVVSYNPFLLKYFEVLINVEVCAIVV